jgi:hypothetical protein
MDLNTRIWTKDVDESLLRQPDRAPTGLTDLPEARAGTLTEKALWEKAVASVGDDFNEEVGKAIPRPERTRIRIDRDGGAFTIRYGWSISFLIFMLLSLAGVAIVFSALKQLTAIPPGADGTALFGWLPTHPAVDRLVGENGIVWLPVAAVVGGLCTLGWLVRVRRVDVAPDAVLIYRGLRPFPRRYPRAIYGDVMRMKNSVHLKRSEGATLFYPTASPNIRDAEAGWVASELRQALR